MVHLVSALSPRDDVSGNAAETDRRPKSSRRCPMNSGARLRTEWADANRPGQPTDCFIEGPSFDADGNLYIVDIPFGRIFRIAPDRKWSLVIEYDGWPNGLKIAATGASWSPTTGTASWNSTRGQGG